MAVIVGDAAVRLRPETGGFAREADDDISRGLPGVAKKAAGFFAVAFAAVKIGGFLKDAVGQATDLGENVSKVNVVFGDAAGEIEAFADTASTALGQSRNQALEAAGTFGTLFTGMGIGQKEAAGLSTDLVTLASDMASFGNATPQEALDALRSGLVGETEPLRRFGVMLSASAIEAEAVRLGLAATGEELSASAKAQATYSLAMQQTSIQQGDFARTSQGLANQQRIMKAQWTDLSTNIGGLFVPALGNAASVVTGGIMPALLGMTRSLPELGDALGAVGDVFRVGFDEGALAVNDATASYSGLAADLLQVAGTAGDMGAVMAEAFADGRAGADLLAQDSLQGLAANIGVIAHGVMADLAPAFIGIQQAVAPALAQISESFSGVFGGGEGGGGVIGVIVQALQFIGPLIGDYIARWLPVIEAVIPIIADVFSQLAPIIGQLVSTLGPVLQQLMPIISQVAGIFASTLLVVIQALAPVIPPLVAAIGQVAQVLAGAFLSVLTQLAPILPQIVQAIASVATALAGALAGALQAIIPILPPLIDALIQLVLAALTPLLPILPMIVGLIAGLIVALAPLLPAIAQIVGQLIALALQALAPLLPLLPMLADLMLIIVNAISPIIPLAVQIIALLIDLAIKAIMPLMPVIEILIGLFVSLVPVIMPIITLWINLVSTMLTFGANLLGGIIGFVSGIVGKIGELIGWFVGLPGRILSAIGNFGRLLWDKGIELIQGLVDGIASAATFVGNVAKNIVNGIIGFINDFIIDGINDLLEFEIAGIEIDVPDIPHIPRLHEGGEFYSGGGEGLALLRDHELVATPEQRRVADDLLRSLLDGNLPAAAAAAAGTAAGVEVTNYITQQPGESGEVLAARVTQSVVWNLNTGATRRIGAGAASPA